MFESLEDRRLFTSVVLGQDGQLVVTGTSGDDQVTIAGQPTELLVRHGEDEKHRLRIPITQVTSILVRMRDGNDKLQLLEETPPTEVHGGLGRDSLSGGAGDEILSGGRGADQISGNEGNDTLRGGRGNDVISDPFGSNAFRGGPGTDHILYSNLSDRIFDGETIERSNYYRDVPLHTNQLTGLRIEPTDDGFSAVVDFTFSDSRWLETVGDAVVEGKFITIEVGLQEWMGSYATAIREPTHTVELGDLAPGRYTVQVIRPDGSVVFAALFDTP